MDNSLNLAKAIDIGRTHEATLLHVKELAQVQREEASIRGVTCQTNNEQEQKNTATDAGYRTRSGRVIRKPERYGQ